MARISLGFRLRRTAAAALGGSVRIWLHVVVLHHRDLAGLFHLVEVVAEKRHVRRR